MSIVGAMENSTVEHNEDRNRFEIYVDSSVAGFAEYREAAGGAREFFHTVVEPEHRGQGLSTPLIRKALDDTRAEGKKVVPTCSAFKNFLSKNEEYRNLVAE